ncbi:MAG: sodium/proline symporter [Desulfovibrionaceae bacterium]|nr:sodium/proline symporter [Desulfovibrionaceae bacterium]
MAHSFFVYLAILVYLGVILYIGFRFSKANENAGDFYLGGRRLGPVAVAMSAEASDMSSWLLMGIPGLCFFCGIADTFWTCLGLALGTYLNWLLVARRLRSYSEKIHAITIPEFFAKRFHDTDRLLIGISAIIIIVFFIPYTASGFAACGKLFSSLFGMSYTSGMLLGAVVIVAYTAMGGFLAASTTDVIQSVVMTVALIVIIWFGLDLAGGWDGVVAAASSVPGYLSITQSANIMTGQAGDYGFLTIISTMAWGLGYFGMPHILLRFMAIRHQDEIAVSRRIGTGWVVIAMGFAILIGIIGYAAAKSGAFEVFQSSSAAEYVIIRFSHILSEQGIIAAFIAGLVLAGILACTMSTADSQLLAAASSVSEDITKRVFGITMSNRGTIRVARLTVFVIAIIGILIARDPNSSVFQIVSFAWAGFGASFGPVMLYALFWKKCTKQGAFAGMVAGGGMVFIWKFLVRPMGGVFGIYELLPAFLVACFAIVTVSRRTYKYDASIEAEFDSVKQ